ncbi:hypothetical protein F5Y13DRAFT_190021 [Hypoxylon sp. FL1857]|nr:hypothetical protein F5Y13DRAFT_190021 [Hypoxylon sp. FL1857]
MYSLRSIILAVAVLGAAPLSLAAPAVDGENGVGLNQVRDVAPEAPILEKDSVEGFDDFDFLMTRAGCYTTSKPGRDCAQATCPSSECKVSDKGNCVWANAKKSRPSGCDACKCAKYSD